MLPFQESTPALFAECQNFTSEKSKHGSTVQFCREVISMVYVKQPPPLSTDQPGCDSEDRGVLEMQSSWILVVVNICPAENSHATQEKEGEERLEEKQERSRRGMHQERS